ncbi:MAG: ROK family protein [Tissierella sp.]|uniref:ROK family protein n=1 Tax=Tissierella sp. TaxID=41274 RepID=UPI003F96AEB5
MEEAKEYLANMLGIIVALIDPNVIVLGGGVALKIPGFVEEIESRLKEKVFKVQEDNIKVIKAKLGDDNGLIGGALYAFNKIGDK